MIDPIEAMIRETREESGLVVRPETVREYDCVHRIQKSNQDDTECFIQDNYYYLCKAEDHVVPKKLEEYEAEETYTLKFIDPDVAIRTNRRVIHSLYDPMIFEREAEEYTRCGYWMA